MTQENTDLKDFILKMLGDSHDDDWSREFTYILVDSLYELKFEPYEYMDDELFTEFLFIAFSYAKQVKQLMMDCKSITTDKQVKDTYEQVLTQYRLLNLESPNGDSKEQAN